MLKCIIVAVIFGKGKITGVKHLKNELTEITKKRKIRYVLVITLSVDQVEQCKFVKLK